MGCINSTKRLTDMNSEDVFRVRVVRLQPDSPSIRNGFLELNPRELIFDHGRETVVWALQHLRRYGLNGDVFSFEAGRRCMTGPGIYVFRCQQADRLYYLFQRYVNAVSVIVDETSLHADRDRQHPSHTFGRPDANSHASYNNYLDPAPIVNGRGTTLRTGLHESFSSSPLSLELDSPDSVPSISFNNEVVLLHPSTPGYYANTNFNVSCNLYLEHPLQVQQEHNNNSTAGVVNNKAGHHFSTLMRQTGLTKQSSLDIPPEERAPMLTAATSDNLHMYANVENLGNNSSAARENNDRERNLDPAERCYENLSRFDLSLLLQPHVPPSITKRETTIQEPLPPSAVNYIVLDLDHPRSPAQCSPKTCFSSTLSLEAAAQDEIAPGGESTDVQPLSSPTTTTVVTTTKKEEVNPTQQQQQKQQQKTESSLGYSTIDFIKTCALIKSSTGGDFDPDHDQEESRITRHSKCVRKAYSISE